ncbi:MAG: tetratricopeptide repeat protein [Muribaculaceae bacterium]|nr:tetratricopeptide repeat protein [Muribaculaceae bacterium]
MASSQYGSTHDRVKDLLLKRNLHEAFSLLRSQLTSNPDHTVSDRLDKLEETYKYMIHYLVEGYADTGREDMLASLIEELHTANDALLRNSILSDSPDLYSAAKRFEKVRNASFNSRFDEYREASSNAMLAATSDSAEYYQKISDDTLAALFSYVWTMFGAPEKEYRSLTDSVIQQDTTFEFKAQIISALMMGCLTYYDKNAFSSLIDIYEADIDQRVSARALVAIMLTVAANPDRIKNDPKLKARLSLWQDSIISYRRLREVLMNIIRTRDTERISSKMQNEVLPELMKLRPEIINKFKNISEEADLEMLEANPEWEELLNKNGLGDKLKELTEMQLEGGDVMMVAFSNLKSFPFFNNVPNWFLPFSTNHSEVMSVSKEFGTFGELLDMEGVMCDSDKFSFAFSIGKMPEAQRNMMTERMSAQMQQLKEAMADRKLKSSIPEFDAEVTRYVRDLYRFFKLFRRKEDFYDPFLRPVDFRALPFLSDVLADMEIVNLVGEFYFKRGYYSEALPMLMLVDKSQQDDSLLWEKIGYCHHALNEIEEAIKWYKKAELINPDSMWLKKKLAVCYRMCGKFEDAAEYYTKALDSSPDNYNLLMSAGNCLVESGDFSAATSHYYHADYIRPGRLSTWRAIAWAELLNGNKEKSLSYYEKLISSAEHTPDDSLNAGHLYYLTGNLKKAIECYKSCASDKDFGIGKLEEGIRHDMEVIEKAGGNRQDLNLLLDKIKYDL